LECARDAVPGLARGLAAVAREAKDRGGGEQAEAGGEESEVRAG
jgi:hypothetical protein